MENLDGHVVIAALRPGPNAGGFRHGPFTTTHVSSSPSNIAPTYADSCFMVMPLEREVPGRRHRDPGMPGEWERRSCSRVPGQTDVVVEARTGGMCPPGDASSLAQRSAVAVSNAPSAVRWGGHGRKLVECQMNLDPLCS